jgi:diguanylate cyclase (GGDEF)-like protein
VVDLGSTNGTYVNDSEIHGETPLRNGDLIKVGGVVFKFISGGNIEGRYHEEIYRMTIIDGLTQIHNKRYFTDFLDREIARCARYGRALSLILFDLDHFKGINDRHGHLAGDFVLKKVAGRVSQQIRREELFARYGGEEFAVVLPESDLEKASIFAEKIRCLVEGMTFRFDGCEITATISAGVTTATGPTDLLEFIKVADERLYEAKRRGRNRVVAR